MNEEIGKKLRLWRTSQGLTLEQTEPILGLSASYISELETGQKDYSRNVIQKYVEASRATKVKILANEFFQ